VLLLGSSYYTVRLLFPVETAVLNAPQNYYTEYRIEYEQYYDETEKIDQLLKASYIQELEMALKINQAVYRKKKHFYYNAFSLALLALFPYIICIGFHIGKSETGIGHETAVHQKK
jgi:hypothetical protein